MSRPPVPVWITAMMPDEYARRPCWSYSDEWAAERRELEALEAELELLREIAQHATTALRFHEIEHHECGVRSGCSIAALEAAVNKYIVGKLAAAPQGEPTGGGE